MRRRKAPQARSSWGRPLRLLSSFPVVDTVIRTSQKPQGSQPAGRDFDRVPSIYKICSASAWREAERSGVYRGSTDDLRDGFIHFSTVSQLAETAHKHFFGQKALFLVEVDADALGAALRW